MLRMPERRTRAVAALAFAIAVAGCVTVPDAQRLVSTRDDGAVEVVSRPCGSVVAAKAGDQSAALGATIRIASWNLHKSADEGWQRDLGRFAHESDVVLLQEALLDDELRRALDAAGLRWALASSFAINGRDAGVLTATRVRPAALCTQWTPEPLYSLPKSTLIARFRLAGRNDTLAIANLHAINFTLYAAGAYREQLAAIRSELSAHEGPIVVAGDFNTWNDERRAAVEEMARGLSLVAVAFEPDARQRFGGHAVDHIFVRGLDVVAATAIAVTSSDHNPIFATLRVREARR
jgi:endonuclease/exonuclease/phosphatase (EEP) superfamily protein YafD